MFNKDGIESFFEKYVKSLKEEFLFLSNYYEHFKSKNASLPIDKLNKKFHEKMLKHLEDEDFEEDSYKLIIQYYDMKIKFPTFLDNIQIKAESSKEKEKEIDPLDFIKTIKVNPTHIVDPCSRGYSGSTFGGC